MQEGKSKHKKVGLFAGLFLMLIVLFITNITLGSVHIPIKYVFSWLFGFYEGSHKWHNILINTRLPQAITSVFAGAALAVSGLQMQTLFRNPLAGPSILGISAGAGLGVAIVILFLGLVNGVALSSFGIAGSLTITVAAFMGAVVVLLLVLFLARKLQNNAMLLIVGIMVGYASSALVGLMQFFSTKDDIQAYVVWGLGSFSNVSWFDLQIFVPVLVVALVASLFLIKPLNIYLLGENYAANLGINVKKSRFQILMVVGLLTATVTAFCGPVAFLGLAVPHLTKNLFKTADHSILVPAVMVFGASLALLCNVIARLPGYDGALPINAVTSLIGAPIVVSVILKRRRLVD